MAESEEELKSLLMKVKEKSEKAGLKLSIQKTKIMASGPITSWQIDEEAMETVRLYFLGPQKRWLQPWNKRLAPWKKSYDLDSRDITLPTNVRLVKAVVFLVVVYGCESWTVKKAERLRIDAFELWC